MRKTSENKCHASKTMIWNYTFLPPTPLHSKQPGQDMDTAALAQTYYSQAGKLGLSKPLSIKETEDLASYIFSSGFIVVHDTG